MFLSGEPVIRHAPAFMGAGIPRFESNLGLGRVKSPPDLDFGLDAEAR